MNTVANPCVKGSLLRSHLLKLILPFDAKMKTMFSVFALAQSPPFAMVTVSPSAQLLATSGGLDSVLKTGRDHR